MPKFSIMVPVCNSFWALRKNFASLVNQDFKDYEICVIDDASLDNSTEVLSTFANNNANIRVLRHRKSMGMGASRNELIAMAVGEYLLFIDPQDSVDADFLSCLNEVIEQGRVDVVNFQSEDGPSTPIISGEDALLPWFAGRNDIEVASSGYAVKKEIYEGVSYPEISLFESTAIMPYIVAKSSRVKAVSGMGYHHSLPELDDSSLPMDERIALKNDQLKLLASAIQLSRNLISKTRISSISERLFAEDQQRKYGIKAQEIMEMQSAYYRRRPR